MNYPPRSGEAHVTINEIVTTYEAGFSEALANSTPVEQAMREASQGVQAILDRG